MLLREVYDTTAAFNKREPWYVLSFLILLTALKEGYSSAEGRRRLLVEQANQAMPTRLCFRRDIQSIKVNRKWYIRETHAKALSESQHTVYVIQHFRAISFKDNIPGLVWQEAKHMNASCTANHHVKVRSHTGCFLKSRTMSGENASVLYTLTPMKVWIISIKLYSMWPR